MTDRRKVLRQLIETERAFGVTEFRVKERPGPDLTALNAEFAACQLCALSRARKNVVFGAGNPHAELMFIGEAPGADEDEQGRPFVGRAGQLLTKIIEAMKLTREQVYIANILKCRPPSNRPPLPTEIAACSPILMRQIDLIHPRVICALGKFAAQTLLGTEIPISKLRGRFFDWKGIKLMPTFHPAYLLRNPGDKKLVWNDMQLIMSELAIQNDKCQSTNDK